MKKLIFLLLVAFATPTFADNLPFAPKAKHGKHKTKKCKKAKKHRLVDCAKFWI